MLRQPVGAQRKLQPENLGWNPGSILVFKSLLSPAEDRKRNCVILEKKISPRLGLS
jgi:hypothetical protein